MNRLEDILGQETGEYERTERLRGVYPILVAYEIDRKPLRYIAADFGLSKGQVTHRLAKERGAYTQLTTQPSEELGTWHGTAYGYTDRNCHCQECTEAYETAQVQHKQAKKEYDRIRKNGIGRENQWRAQGIIGMTQELYDSILRIQENRCAICGRHATEFVKRLYVDHDHSITDRFNVRGLVCPRCNVGLGFIDRGELLPGPKHVKYLERFASLALVA